MKNEKEVNPLMEELNNLIQKIYDNRFLWQILISIFLSIIVWDLIRMKWKQLSMLEYKKELEKYV
jgi:hypothetical protein